MLMTKRFSSTLIFLVSFGIFGLLPTSQWIYFGIIWMSCNTQWFYFGILRWVTRKGPSQQTAVYLAYIRFGVRVLDKVNRSIAQNKKCWRGKSRTSFNTLQFHSFSRDFDLCWPCRSADGERLSFSLLVYLITFPHQCQAFFKPFNHFFSTFFTFCPSFDMFFNFGWFSRIFEQLKTLFFITLKHWG